MDERTTAAPVRHAWAMYSLGDVVRAARQRRGWSQRELAAYSGVAQPNVAAIEAGRRVPSIALVARLVGACGWQLRHELEPRHAEVDARVRALLGQEPATRPGRAGAALLLTLSRLVTAGARVVLDGPLAARLHGAPVSDSVERVWCAVADLDRLGAAARRCHLDVRPVQPRYVEDGDDLRLAVREGDRLRLDTGVVTLGAPPAAAWLAHPYGVPLTVVDVAHLADEPGGEPADRVAVRRLLAVVRQEGPVGSGLDPVP